MLYCMGESGWLIISFQKQWLTRDHTEGGGGGGGGAGRGLRNYTCNNCIKHGIMAGGGTTLNTKPGVVSQSAKIHPIPS